MLPKTVIAALIALGVSLAFLIVFATDNAEIGYVNGFEANSVFKYSFFMNKMVTSSIINNNKTFFVSTHYCKFEEMDFFDEMDLLYAEKFCDIHTKLRGFSISAVVFNSLAILVLFVLTWKPNYLWILILLLTGLLTCTSGVLAEQVNLMDQFFEILEKIQANSSQRYTVGF